MKKQIRHIPLLLLVTAVASTLSGCQNQRNGVFGSNNWGNNGQRAFLDSAANPANFNPLGGRSVGYIVYGNNTGAGARGVGIPSQAGTVKQGSGQLSGGQNNGAGGIAGGLGGQGTPCLLKIASVSANNYASGSNQTFGAARIETSLPGSGRGIYQTGVASPITCGKDSEIAATANAFYVTGGTGSNQIWIYRVNKLGMPFGPSTPISTVFNPTKIAAGSSGHVAVIGEGGRTLTLIYEGRIGGDGGRLADVYHSIPAQNGALFTDVTIDVSQGAIYAGQKLPGGAGRILILDINQAYNGNAFSGGNFAQAPFDSYGNNQPLDNLYNFQHNLPQETSVSYLFRQAAPTRIKNNQGLTGILTTTGRPFFMETVLGLSAAETAGKTPEELNEIYKNNENLSVQEIKVYNPFEASAHANSSFVQPSYMYKDFAIGKDIGYFITDRGMLNVINVNSMDPFGANVPWTTRINLGQRVNTIEMSEDHQFAVVAGSNGLNIGRVAGNNLIFSSTGVPDISENGEVIHAAVLEKVYVEAAPTQPAPEPVSKNAAAKE